MTFKFGFFTKVSQQIDLGPLKGFNKRDVNRQLDDSLKPSRSEITSIFFFLPQQ